MLQVFPAPINCIHREDCTKNIWECQKCQNNLNATKPIKKKNWFMKFK